MNKTTEKIISLLGKYKTRDELIETYLIIKGTISGLLKQEQERFEKESEETSAKIQSQINLINSN